MIYVSKCILCGGSSLTILKKHRFIPPRIDDFPNGIEELSYHDIRNWVLVNEIIPRISEAVFCATLCESCGMIFNNPRFTEDELKRKYAIFEGLDKEDKPHIDGVTRKNEERGKRIIKTAKSFFGLDSIRRVLDYGGADGSVLQPFAAAGYDCDLIDYKRDDLPDGVNYVGKDHRDIKNGETYDMILCLHVLEHVPYPEDLISKIVSHLRDDGLIYIEVPLGCWREWKVQKEPLTHINFFGEVSVFNLLSRIGLHPLALKTSYQYVPGNTMWCVNAFASKNPGKMKVRVKPTKKQIGNPYYYIAPFITKPTKVIKKLSSRLTPI